MRKIVVSVVTALVAGVLVLTGLIAASAPAGAAPVPHCKGALLKITHNRPQGATGHSNVILRFRNISQATCSLHGYPGLDALGKHGKVLKHAKRTKHGFTGGAKSVRTIVLKPNRVASADVEWHNFNFKTGENCKISKSIATTAPNTARTVHFKVSVSVCGLQVHPVVKGETGDS